MQKKKNKWEQFLSLFMAFFLLKMNNCLIISPWGKRDRVGINHSLGF